ncbi:DUF2971 domain-containing protein [Mycobacterium sp. M23085]|uniref:DUF2971 domain-containing protein n=1 Tax=Mycobacterium sp. M23085 TaxID=3378087 RepID=UPI00387841FB
MMPDHPDIDDCLFHYTTAGGLLGILTSRSIRATDSAFLNDSSEISFAGRAVERFLGDLYLEQERLYNHPPGSVERQRMGLMEEARAALADFNEAEYHLDGNHRSVYDGATYVSCFTEKPNQLSQWRGYGGRGYSIGFTKDGLGKLVVEQDDAPVGEIVQVGYGEPALAELYKEVNTFFRSRPVAPLPGPISDLAGSFDFIFPRLAKVKHGAFEEEREWRAIVSRYVQWSADPLSFREGVRIVPYLNLKFEPEALAWIYIGPGGNMQDKRALRAFLAKNGYNLDRVWIELSGAPYRGD